MESETLRRLHQFSPDLVVLFGPDHFNGFFYELMPTFCVGLAAEGTKDWGVPGGPLRVPKELALDCARHLHREDFDVAVSYDMKVDHGMTVPLMQLTGALTRYDVLPIFMNCAADPRPSFRRSRLFGEAVGRFLSTKKDLNITLIGSGGLSHDPPTPRLDPVDEEAETPAEAHRHRQAWFLRRCAAPDHAHGRASIAQRAEQSRRKFTSASAKTGAADATVSLARRTAMLHERLFGGPKSLRAASFETLSHCYPTASPQGDRTLEGRDRDSCLSHLPCRKSTSRI